jgi:hypothetical protein
MDISCLPSREKVLFYHLSTKLSASTMNDLFALNWPAPNMDEINLIDDNWLILYNVYIRDCKITDNIPLGEYVPTLVGKGY